MEIALHKKSYALTEKWDESSFAWKVVRPSIYRNKILFLNFIC